MKNPIRVSLDRLLEERKAIVWKISVIEQIQSRLASHKKLGIDGVLKIVLRRDSGELARHEAPIDWGSIPKSLQGLNRMRENLHIDAQKLDVKIKRRAYVLATGRIVRDLILRPRKTFRQIWKARK